MASIEEVRKIWAGPQVRDMDFINEIIPQLNISTDSKILDIGTGWGMMSISLALSGYTVVTGEPEMWHGGLGGHGGHHGHGPNENRKDWRQVAKDLKVDGLIEYQQFNAETLPFPDESFDAVFMYNTLHHVSDKKGALNECLRVANAKGIVCIIEMNKAGNEYMRKSSGFRHEVADPRDFLEGDSYSIDHRKGQYADSFILKKTG